MITNFIDDIPQQFKNKKNIAVLINSYVEQIEELFTVFNQLEQLNLGNAQGKNLDMEGDILSLSRKQAYDILLQSDSFKMTDEFYRSCLQYQKLKNNCSCTYDDMMRGFSLVWGTTDINYIEDPQHPATVIITMPLLDADEDDPWIGKALAIKPSGVKVLYTGSYKFGVEISNVEKVENINLTNRFIFRWYREYNRFNGTFNFDGTRKFNSKRYNVPVHCVTKVDGEIVEEEDI